MADKMSIDKKDESEDSMESSPGVAGATNTTSPTGAAAPTGTMMTATATMAPQEIQAPKRKGGRKPIYATSEERKQRNRQAQAAFRERRTEYIKQLEDTIRVHESNLHNLQAAHRSAADECLMLRYKNSLLERILLEKGIDVQAELRDKTGSPTLGPTHVPQNIVQPPALNRTLMNRHQSRRSTSSIAPKIETGISILPPSMPTHSSVSSPKSHATPSTHSNSPTAATPTYSSHMGPTSMSHDITGGARPTLSVKPGGMSGPSVRQIARSGPTFRVGTNPGTSPFYPTPSFQNHIKQLEQEYDAQAEMIDDPEAETPGPGPYPLNFAAADQQPMAMSPTTASTSTNPATTSGPQLAPSVRLEQAQHYPSMTQLSGPSMDWDPFGLSASMQFPTQFSFDTSNLR